MEEIEELQSKLLEKMVQEDHPALETLRETVRTNSATMKENLDNLKQRFSNAYNA